MKKKLFYYAPPQVETIVLLTEQCMANASGNESLNDLAIIVATDELGD